MVYLVLNAIVPVTLKSQLEVSSQAFGTSLITLGWFVVQTTCHLEGLVSIHEEAAEKSDATQLPKYLLCL